MKITCTEEEKSGIIFMLAEGKTCFLPFKCTYYSNKECRECIERNIEWEIKDGEQGEVMNGNVDTRNNDCSH